MMTQYEIIRMAQEAGYQSVYLSDAPIGRSYKFLERFADLVAEPWIETNKALAKEIIEMKKQAEQDTAMKQLRDAHEAQGRDETWNCNEYMRGLFNGLELALAICECREPEYREALAEQADQEPVAWMDNDGNVCDNNDFGDAFPIPLYAAPVRTKDLTDDEIWDALTSIGFGTSCYEDARAVIAADREKNK